MVTVNVVVLAGKLSADPEVLEMPSGDRVARLRLQVPEAGMRVLYGRLLGLLFCVAGFIVIALGWNGMAREACPDCQLPYIVSGGAGGVALVLFGVALLVLAQLRAERIRLAEQIG